MRTGGGLGLPSCLGRAALTCPRQLGWARRGRVGPPFSMAEARTRRAEERARESGVRGGLEPGFGASSRVRVRGRHYSWGPPRALRASRLGHQCAARAPRCACARTPPAVDTRDEDRRRSRTAPWQCLSRATAVPRLGPVEFEILRALGARLPSRLGCSSSGDARRAFKARRGCAPCFEKGEGGCFEWNGERPGDGLGLADEQGGCGDERRGGRGEQELRK
jgi:hypothetical protein